MLILQIIDKLFLVYMLMLFARILSSWLPELREYRVMQFVSYYTDPYLNFFRGIIPTIGMLDISPLFAFLCLGVIEYIIKALVASILF